MKDKEKEGEKQSAETDGEIEGLKEVCKVIKSWLPFVSVSL